MRGQSKDEVVEKLLIHTIGMVNDLDLDLVMMDREFASKPVKNTCEEYGVHYLNPTRIFANSDEAETIGGYLSFSRLFADIQREEEVEERKQKAQDGEVDTAETAVFETNHPYVTIRDADGQQMDGKEFIHIIERLIRWYRRHWGIENGFKKQNISWSGRSRPNAAIGSSTSRSRACCIISDNSSICS